MIVLFAETGGLTIIAIIIVSSISAVLDKNYKNFQSAK